MFISALEMCLAVLYRNIYMYFFTCFTAIDERSGSGSWGSAEQDSPSFSQGRVRFTHIHKLLSHTHNLIIQTTCMVFIHLNKVHVSIGAMHVF